MRTESFATERYLTDGGVSVLVWSGQGGVREERTVKPNSDSNGNYVNNLLNHSLPSFTLSKGFLGLSLPFAPPIREEVFVDENQDQNICIAPGAALPFFSTIDIFGKQRRKRRKVKACPLACGSECRKHPQHLSTVSMHATDLLPSPPRRGIRSFLGVPSKKDGPAKRSSFGAIFLKNKSRSGAGTEKELDVIMKHLVQKEHEDALSDKSEKKNLFQRLKLLPPTATKRESTPTTIVTAPEEEPAQCSTNDDKEFDFDGYSTWVFEETASPESEYPFLVFSAEEVSDDLALLEIQTITSDGESNSREIMLDFSELEQPNSEPGAVEISDSSHSSMRAPFDERLAESHQPPDPVLQQASLPRGPFNNVIRPSMAELSKQWTMRSKTFVEKLTQAQRCASSHSTQQQRSLPSCFFVEFCTNEDAVSDNETQATMKHAEPTRSSQKALSNMLSEAMKNGSILLAATFETFNPKTEDEKEGSSIIDKKSENTKKGSMMTNYKTDTENTQSQKAAAKPRPEKYQAMADLLDEDDDPEPQAVPKEEKVDVTGSKWKYRYFSSDAFRLSLSPSGWETEQPSENNPNTYTLVEFAADKEHDATVWQDSFTGHYTPKNWSTDSNYDAEDEKEKDTSVSTTSVFVVLATVRFPH